MESLGKTHQKELDDDLSPKPITLSKYSNRVELKTLLERSDRGAGLVGKRLVIGGWVKSCRAVKKDSPPPPVVGDPSPSSGGDQSHTTANIRCTEIIQSKMNIFRRFFDVLSGGGGKTYPIFDKTELAGQKAPPPPEYVFYFLISDGSSVSSLQVVVDSALSTVPATQLMALGTCIVAEGVLRLPLAASTKHVIELEAEKLLHVGVVDPEKYPLSKKQLPLHMLRDYSHFRPRTTTVGSVTRVHSALTLASHTFLQYHGFLYVQVPVITTTRFGEMFRVTTLLGKTDNKEEKKPVKEKDGFSIDTVKAAIKEKTRLIDHLKRSDSNREAVVAAVHDLKKTSDLASQLEMKQNSKSGTTLVKSEKLDFSKDFFGRDTYLTASGRFHLESYASALGKVYTFGPRFVADKIDNARHLAEMWNVETEMAFSELDDAMDCADEYFKFLCKYILENRQEDMKFISKRVDKTITTRLEATASSSLLRFSYTEAINLLQKATARKFETKPEWGVALTTEHLSYLTDEIYKGPVIIHSYPKVAKPFYVRLNDDKKTVAAFDLVVPKVGVVITGSQNEERFEVLNARIGEFGFTREKFEWYLDLRRHGTVKHSGISLSMEHMLLFATGLPDIKDAIPFPRSWGNANN
ncbi:PREDICTED: asparagine--tRNA ligase, cytoplasmic 2 isoform X2 [Camelina sativa]|uniref:Asparagine--tRNA ligase, cytoplasmic 2 isoform X1 n=1 Tax=Camelina sativa TaxID=90675 RepID=A0ABM1RN86_CAMSA|nr:PREDICTED: asparagine--tRNA ligase, cytoplasmic 2 isoform X1 [Camelina sativa]XP_019100474.1 PREDICTED: asparagine--tRNA ligase, cytoplasmic 2 isoform X2 [Camelina sativa]